MAVGPRPRSCRPPPLLYVPPHPSLSPATPGLPQAPALQDLSSIAHGPTENEVQAKMPPPSAPSQKPSAQELRDIARQSAPARGDKPPTVSPLERKAVEAAQSPAPRRSQSPARPGTRNTSSDSRASGERDRDRERLRSDRLPLVEPSRAERNAAGNRDALHGRSDRNGRDRIPGSSTRDAERERDRERETDRVRDKQRDGERGDRDRDREKEKTKDREREGSHRDRDRDRERDRDKDREREKDRDRHRRDEKDRERERKDATRNVSSNRDADSPGDLEGSSSSRRRDHSGADEGLGKRRRPVEDEPERASKRGSRHREERSRRLGEKEGVRESVRESERRRKDRDGAEIEGRGNISSDKQLDRPPHLTDQTSPLLPSSSSASIALSLKTSIIPPSAPRAMAASSPRTGRGEAPAALSASRDRERERERDKERDRPDRDRNDRTERERANRERPDRAEKAEKEDGRANTREREWRTNREATAAASAAAAAATAASASTLPANGNSALSLRSRIGDALPTGRGGPSNNELMEGKKRTVTERERDALLDSALGVSNSSSAPSGSIPPKRVKLRRDRR